MTVRLANGMVDVDGTLLDILDRFAGAMRGAFADKVTRLPGWNAIRAILGRSLCTAVATLAAAATAGRHARRVAGHSEAFAPAQARPARRAPLQPEAAAMPGPLSTDPGVVPDVATGMPRHGLSRRLDPPALPGVIATLQCADGHRAKPHPSMAPACLPMPRLRQATPFSWAIPPSTWGRPARPLSRLSV